MAKKVKKVTKKSTQPTSTPKDDFLEDLEVCELSSRRASRINMCRIYNGKHQRRMILSRYLVGQLKDFRNAVKLAYHPSDKLVIIPCEVDDLGALKVCEKNCLVSCGNYLDWVCMRRNGKTPLPYCGEYPMELDKERNMIIVDLGNMTMEVKQKSTKTVNKRI